MARSIREDDEMMCVAISTAFVAGLLGFFSGLCLFRAKAQWCGECGATLNCPVCMGAGAHRLPSYRG
jgi:hypothetical protein